MDSQGQPAGQAEHARIGPTAWAVAYRRTFFDIPYARDIFDELKRIMQPPRLTPELAEEQACAHDLQFEARFRLVSQLLEENRAKQILEIASGFSPRGLAMTHDGSVEYVEADLPDIIKAKKEIVRKLVQEAKAPDG